MLNSSWLRRLGGGGRKERSHEDQWILYLKVLIQNGLDNKLNIKTLNCNTKHSDLYIKVKKFINIYKTEIPT